MKVPLTLRRGEKLPLLGARPLPGGSRMLPGGPEHLAHCWVDYQFRHPRKYRRFSYSVDPEWERLYRSILSNKLAGTAFEDSILLARGYEKNTSLLMPPPGGKAQGFIPDSVRGNPDELVWGQPYHFVEVKGHHELQREKTRLTGPLQKDLEDLIQDGEAAIRYYP